MCSLLPPASCTLTSHKSSRNWPNHNHFLPLYHYYSLVDFPAIAQILPVGVAIDFLAQVGEFSTIVCTSSSDTSIVLSIFDLWIAKTGFEVGSHHLGNLPPATPANYRVGGGGICSGSIGATAHFAETLPGEGFSSFLIVKNHFCCFSEDEYCHPGGDGDLCGNC